MATQQMKPALITPPQTEEEEIEYYYDLHPTKEDLMSESYTHSQLIHYLMNLLAWQYHTEGWLIADNLAIYQTSNQNEHPLSPDVAVFKGAVLSADDKARLTSWKMLLPNRPPPTVVIELASKKTWKEDLYDKPTAYLQMGVKEYFAYDPNLRPLGREKRKWLGVRLKGWRYTNHQLEELKLDERGWLWSNELDSWLVPDGAFLRLYTPDGVQRLTKDEAADARAERFAAKLRELKIDPDTL